VLKAFVQDWSCRATKNLIIVLMHGMDCFVSCQLIIVYLVKFFIS